MYICVCTHTSLYMYIYVKFIIINFKIEVNSRKKLLTVKIGSICISLCSSEIRKRNIYQEN